MLIGFSIRFNKALNLNFLALNFPEILKTDCLNLITSMLLLYKIEQSTFCFSNGIYSIPEGIFVKALTPVPRLICPPFLIISCPNM